MAVLQKIRVKFGLAISIIIALALLSFIIDPSTLETALNSMSAKYDVGKIDNKKISYTNFQEDVDKYSTIQKIISGSSVQNEETQKQIRDIAWQNLVDKYLFQKKAKAAGIKVGEDEIVDLLCGDNVSSIISQNPVFADENGVFSKERLIQFKDNLDNDASGQSRLYWNFLQSNILSQQYFAKYSSLFVNSAAPNALSLANDIAENNSSADFEYVVYTYPFVEDSTVTVSEKEAREYYNLHKKNYKRAAGRNIEYVLFEVVPSAEDIAAVSNSFTKAYDEFTAASDKEMKAFLLKNSERQLSAYWFNKGELASVAAELGKFVDDAKVGAVSPIIKTGNSFYAAKVTAVAEVPGKIKVRLLPMTGTVIADSLVTKLRETEPMEMTQSYLIPGCEVLFTAKVNKPQIVKTVQYGNLLAELVEKSDVATRKQVAILEKTALAGKETFNRYYSEANKFAGLANGSYEGYRKAVDSLKVYSHVMNNVLESTSSYGSVESAKEITRWVFDAKKGKASQIITVNQNFFFVVAVKDAYKEGYTPFDDVKNGIQTILLAQKREDKTRKDVAEKIAGLTSLQEIATALESSVEKKEGVAFSTTNGAALDPAVLGAALNAEEGKICGPVKGSIGVYVFTVSGKKTGSFYTEEDAKNLASQKAQYSAQMVVPAMMEAADVKDNRARFY